VSKLTKVELQQEQTIATLKTAAARLMSRLAQEKERKQDLIAAVYRAAKDAASAVQLKPVRRPKLIHKSGTPETAIAVLSDWQLGKRTVSYNSEVCEERIERYGDRVIRLANLQRYDHPVDDLVVALLGDICEGELIFPGQAHAIDSSLFLQVMTNGPRILGNFVRRMCGQFRRVHVDGVIGNHGSLGGRARREYHPESNADAMLYEATRMRLGKQGRLTWAPNIIARERKWYSVARVGKYGFLLWHGDQVKGGFAGYSWYGFGKKLLGWSARVIKEPWHYSLAGHFHTPVRMYVNGIEHWGNGSTESDNTYAAEQLAASGEPCQWLLFCHPEKGVSAEYLVRLRS